MCKAAGGGRDGLRGYPPGQRAGGAAAAGRAAACGALRRGGVGRAAGADPGKGRCVLPLCVGAYDRPGPQRHAGADREHPLHHCGLPRRGAAGLPGLYRGRQSGRVWPRGGRSDRAYPLLPGERLRHGQAVRRPDEPRRVPGAGHGPHLDAYFECVWTARRPLHDDQRYHP